MRARYLGWLVLAGLAVGLSASDAQDKKKDDKKPKKAAVFTDPKEAGPDFLIQGEYAADKAGHAAQVVARGDGKFDIYFLTGGLPGAGWDGKGRVKVEAKTADGKVNFAGKEWSGTIENGLLVTKGAKLMRVERKSPTLGARPLAGAIVLFDGANADEWNKGKLVENNLLFCGTSSKRKLGAGKLHIEFRTPFQPTAGGQGRGNSGVYVHGIGGMEVQVLDSFGLTGAGNECGAFYGKAKPAVNMCLPPLSWQTYDIDILADDKGNTVGTVLHNGVKVHDNLILAKKPPSPTSINLQNHGNPVVYRNIWFVEAK